MEIVILILLIALIGLVAALLFRLSKPDDGKEKMEALLNKGFMDFSDRIRQTMDTTRKEVESSKDILSRNALDTLNHIKGMSDTVSNLVKQQEKAEELGKSLEYLLQAPKLRGSYGETILEEMLDRALPKGIWEKQYEIEGGERVDAVVKIKDVIIPIDSKFPKDDYQKYLSATDSGEKKRHWANYEKALKVQINSIKDKYIKPEKGTAQFALLFIPSESIYYETIAEKNFLGDPCEIQEYATDRKVIPVSPNTFFAFLQVIVIGLHNIKIARGAKQLQEALSKVQKDFDRFFGKYENIGKALEKAAEAYRVGDGHIQRYKKDLDTTLKLDTDFQEEAEHELLEDDRI